MTTEVGTLHPYTGGSRQYFEYSAAEYMQTPVYQQQLVYQGQYPETLCPVTQPLQFDPQNAKNNYYTDKYYYTPQNYDPCMQNVSNMYTGIPMVQYFNTPDLDAPPGIYPVQEPPHLQQSLQMQHQSIYVQQPPLIQQQPPLIQQQPIHMQKPHNMPQQQPINVNQPPNTQHQLFHVQQPPQNSQKSVVSPDQVQHTSGAVIMNSENTMYNVDQMNIPIPQKVNDTAKSKVKMSLKNIKKSKIKEKNCFNELGVARKIESKTDGDELPNTTQQEKHQPAYTQTQNPIDLKNMQFDAQQDKQSENLWPESLKNYAVRIFDSCPPDKISVVEKKLKDKIIQAINKNTMWQIDWDKMPLLVECTPSEKGISNGQKSHGGKLDTSIKHPRSPSKEHHSKKKKNAKDNKKSGYHTKAKSLNLLTPKYLQQQQQSLLNNSSEKLKIKLDEITDPFPIDTLEGQREIAARDERKKRFKLDSLEDNSRSNTPVATPSTTLTDYNNPSEYSEFRIIRGLCTKLEKRYLRLTSAPDESTVRPPEILEKSFELVMNKWNTEHNYTYVCDQLKSIRQDLMVQHVRNEFTVKIYEAHARISLQMGDLGEFNQCLGQIMQLYASESIKNSRDEFIAYGILYHVLIQNKTEMVKLMFGLTPENEKSEPISHALKVRSAVYTGNFDLFFKLYNNSPNMGKNLLSHMADRQRVNAVSLICKSFRPSIPLHYLAKHLGFVSRCDDTSDVENGEKECFEWLESKDVVFVKNDAYENQCIKNLLIDTKLSIPIFNKHVLGYKIKSVDLKGQMH